MKDGQRGEKLHDNEREELFVRWVA